ncbi:MAG: hypothetical protein AAF378_03840 [Cyanobacteria bacterium P01_A01_bin.84]
MGANSFPINQVSQHLPYSKRKILRIQAAQENIYNSLIDIVKNDSPENALKKFKSLFIDSLISSKPNTSSGIYKILLGSNELEFRYTIKRCSYILINNWESNRKYIYIQNLVDLFTEYKLIQNDYSYSGNVFRTWLDNFIESEDYQELTLFARKHQENVQGNWVYRYSAYLLVAQSLDKDNPLEQQEAARKLSRKLKNKFKFELAMYIARSQSSKSHITRYNNPSIFGDNVLHLIKTIVLKRGVFSYGNLANIFIKQIQNQTFLEFKYSLQKYLIYSVKETDNIKKLKKYLSDKILLWRPEHHEIIVNKELILRACTKVINFLTSDNGNKPSPAFESLISQGHSLTLVIILLKIILICHNSRSHLEMRIANLINYYKDYSEIECKSFVSFIEIFNITFAIYADNVEYNLIKMSKADSQCQSQKDLDAYRVFSQLKFNEN